MRFTSCTLPDACDGCPRHSRNRRLYAEAWPGIRLLDKDGRLAIAVAGELYRAILADSETHDYDVFHRRAHVNGRRKLLSLPGIWWRNR